MVHPSGESRVLQCTRCGAQGWLRWSLLGWVLGTSLREEQPVEEAKGTLVPACMDRIGDGLCPVLLHGSVEETLSTLLEAKAVGSASMTVSRRSATGLAGKLRCSGEGSEGSWKASCGVR